MNEGTCNRGNSACNSEIFFGPLRFRINLDIYNYLYGRRRLGNLEDSFSAYPAWTTSMIFYEVHAELSRILGPWLRGNEYYIIEKTLKIRRFIGKSPFWLKPWQMRHSLKPDWGLPSFISRCRRCLRCPCCQFGRSHCWWNNEMLVSLGCWQPTGIFIRHDFARRQSSWPSARLEFCSNFCKSGARVIKLFRFVITAEMPLRSITKIHL